jgi:hypothetical protein
MGAEVHISAPILGQSQMAYVIACGIVLMSVVNLAFVALMTRETA